MHYFGKTTENRFVFALRAGLLLLAGINFACASGNSSSGPPPPTFPFVYVTNEGDNTVTEYRVKSGGALQLIGSIQTGRRPGGILTTTGIDPTGNGDQFGMVFVVNRDDNTISQYYIQDGVFTSSPGLLVAADTPTVPTGPNPSAITYDRTANRYYVTSQGDNTVTAYKLNLPGGQFSTKASLQQVSRASTGSAPADASGSVIVNSGDDTVSAFVYRAATEAFVPDSPPSVPAGSGAVRVWADDDTAVFAPFYVVSSRANTIQPYDVTESFGVVAHPAQPTGRQPDAVVADRASNFVYVANFGDNSISLYQQQDTGLSLKPLTGGAGTGSGPYDLALVFFSGQKYLYCINRNDNALEEFLAGGRDVNGAIQALSSVQTGPMPARLAAFIGDKTYVPKSSGSLTVPIR